jgi:hypothetical protein
MLNKINIFLPICILTIFGCENNYEKVIIGEYEINVGQRLKQGDLSRFVLNKDLTFVVEFEGKEMKGNWEAGDNGDWTWIKFLFDNGTQVDGRILGQDYEIIMIYNPSYFYYPISESLLFKRIKK